MSVLQIPIHAHKFTISAYSPWERVNIDTMGPFPVDEYGNEYIIVIIDCFSHFVMLYATKDATAISAAKAMLHCIGMFGVPMYILSDNGPQYVNQLITELIYLMGSDHQLTTAYSHQENAVVERANKEVLRHLRALVFHQNVITRWSLCLPLVQRIFNAEPISSIGCAPAQIVFGNSINLDKGILLPFKAESLPSNAPALSLWTANMLQAQADIIRAAQELLIIKDQESRDLDSDRVHTRFENNSYVLVKYDQRPPTKLNTHYRGPLRVVNSIGSIYTLQNLVTGSLEDHHISKLQPFYYDPLITDPVSIANKDKQMVVVESISEMRGDPNGSRKDLFFKVHWKDCPDRDDSWESYSNLRHNEVLHAFLIAKKLRRLIPR